MDKILEGLVSSSHPLPLKRVIVRRVVESAETPLSQAQCRAMFALSTRLVLQGPDPFQRQVGRQVLEAYGRYHRAEFEAFFNRGLVLGLLQRGYGELSNRDPAILDYIQAGLRLIMSCPSVLELFELLQVEALRLVCERPAPPLCARLCQLLGDFPQCLPRGRKLSLAFCQQLVRSIAHFQSQGSREAELRLYVSQVTQVSGLLRSVWKAEPDTLLPSLQELFAVISAAGEHTSFEPSVALASVVQHIPLQMITVLIRSLTTDPNVKDASMTQALCRMIDWLSWPLAQHVETWVIALLKGLAAVQKFTILIDVTLLKIELVFNRLWFPLVRPGALAVLSHMLLSFQHSPEAFHLIVPHVVSLVHSFKRDGLPSSTAFLMQLTELIHCMMYHYSGFPELYEPILEAVKDMPKPTEEKIKLILSQSAWTSQSSSLPSCLSRLSGKSETGKTGLINLGNTCYMNIVFNCSFHCKLTVAVVASSYVTLSVPLLREQREAYAPRIFFEASRPPWFTPRSQQDCSEYLRFLLDRYTACMGSEERTLIEKMFGGKLKTTICCLNCKSMSQKEEAFTDLSLAFCPPTSLENVSPKCMEPTSPAGETPLNNLEVNGGCDTIMNEGTTKDFSTEPNSENTTNSELDKGQDNRDMSQRLVGKNTLSVTDLLNYFLAPEILSGDNKYYCEKCASLQNAEKTMQIIEEPEYLILTLLRFSYDPKCHIRRKILDNVSLPLVLELSVVVHSGVSSESGHYYSYARNVTGSGPSGLCHQSTVPREWFLFNDSRVTFTSFQSVQKITSRFPKDTAYVLFYKKQNSTCGFNTSSANGLWINGDPPLQKDLMDAITKDNKLYLQVRWKLCTKSGLKTGKRQSKRKKKRDFSNSSNFHCL
uniref:Ubiquitin specific peptidase 38 n=1 Tax=Strix occidentalis caurina TaxID=311401 RepID=A0A8D0EY65_STROC